MRKLYALLAGLFISLVGIQINAQQTTTDLANFTYSVDASNNNVIFTNTSVLGSVAGTRHSLWSFGDGSSQWTGALDGTQHHYQLTGTYTVCLKIYRYGSNLDSVLSAEVCKTIVIESACRANFEFRDSLTHIDPLKHLVYFWAIPFHSANKPVTQVCWKFGDGTDTCINFSPNVPPTNPLAIQHTYYQQGPYNVCVRIKYLDGCVAEKCKLVVLQSIPRDSCKADFEKIPVTTSNNLLTVAYRALPWNNNKKKPAVICWTFGDGKDTCIKYIKPYIGRYAVAHTYREPGLYEVCVKILYYGGCESKKCKPIQIGRPDSCSADFERLPVISTNNPLQVYFKALPWHNNHKKPAAICWLFGDGRDTCIKYEQTYTGLYTVSHRYNEPGTYEACVKILYFGGCESKKCKLIIVTRPDSCRADFEQIPTTANTPLTAYFRALPWNNNNKKPARICWTFGDGRDTCVKYESSYTGQYVIGHHYQQRGEYEVCVKILYDGGCEAGKCKRIRIDEPDSCSADFETISVASNSLRKYFIASPWHNHNKKPVYICWTFGDGRDTCIQYSTTFSGPYAVGHNYNNTGQYEVCVRIVYDGGCESKKCKLIIVTRPDSCRADFEQIPTTANVSLATYFRALPWNNNNKKPARICWTFGDGRDTCVKYESSYTGQYVIGHHYQQRGEYEVCVKILYDGGCEAGKCKRIQIGEPDSCSADFETISVASNSLRKYFIASPWHNHNKKPVYICWKFGDNHDTCIQYSTTFSGPYAVGHNYNNTGQYEVCVRIVYDGGCESKKCKLIIVTRPDSCRADFEQIPTTANVSLATYFRALPWNNNNKKPARICWTFGDGRDTCVKYESSYTGQYVIGHHYQQRGEYEVCVKILYDGGCEAGKCKRIQIGEPDSCSADFETISVASNSLRKYFIASPWHNHNKKPVYICWKFGDNHDTCIQYSTTFSGPYAVGHNYNNAGQYEVCVRIVYDGGCESKKCKLVQAGERDSCSADFERSPLQDNDPLTIGLKALPWNSNNHKPSRICWTFGDGRDTCISYPENYTGLYLTGHRYHQPGQYEVCIKILYYGGCEAKKCKLIVIPPPYDTCAVRLFEIAPSLTSLVRGFYVSTSSTNDRRPERICYWFGDGTDTCIQTDTPSPTSLPEFLIRHTYPAPGVYKACVKVQFHGGCIAYNCIEVVIRSATDICGGYMIDSLTGPRTFKFKGFSIHSRNDQAVGYRWAFGDGSAAPGQEITHTYNEGGPYEVCLYIKTQLGCETRICKTVHVPGNNQPALQLSPNPVINVLHVQFFSTHTEQVNIKIVSASGIIVRNYTRNVTVGSNNWDLDLSSLLPGIYSFVIQSPNQLASAILLKQ